MNKVILSFGLVFLISACGNDTEAVKQNINERTSKNVPIVKNYDKPVVDGVEYTHKEFLKEFCGPNVFDDECKKIKYARSEAAFEELRKRKSI